MPRLHSRGSPTPNPGRKSDVATSSLPSRRPTIGWNCYATPAFSGVPSQKGRKFRKKRLPHPYLLRGAKEGGTTTQPLRSRGSPTKKVQNKNWLCHPCLVRSAKMRGIVTYLCILGGPQRVARGENWNSLPHPCLLTGPKEGGIAMSPLHSRGSPTPSAGRKSEMATSPLPSQGRTIGRNCYVTPPVSGFPIKREGNHKRLLHPCLPKGPKKGGMAT